MAEPVDLGSVDAVATALEQLDYVASRGTATSVFLAEQLGKPILVEGPPGVGKTELAKAIAATSGRRLVRLQCYEGQDETKALYEWDYGKQLLYTQLLRERVDSVLADTEGLQDAAERLGDEADVFFSERFLVERPLLDAIRSPEPTVLLIDEIDRADEQLEALMLEILAEFQVTIPELGTLEARTRPIVVLTSNATREVSEALKRRCLHLALDYPTRELELEILRRKVPEVSADLLRQVVDLVHGVRELDLRKAPSISETLDWARALALLNVELLDEDVVRDTLSLIVKHERDTERVGENLEDLLRAAREGPSGDGPAAPEAGADGGRAAAYVEDEIYKSHSKGYFGLGGRHPTSS